MKTTQHIPAPWIVTFGKYNASIHTDVTIASISDDALAWEANARLIAAAPDMFQALQAIFDAFGDQDSLLIDQCKAALAKAEGRTK
jgi:hypothetical protein